jgi:FkbM family methyltransferase
VTADSFVSYAQNGEDVVLFRALGAVEGGRYVDVGANDPVHLSVTYAFYLRGWSGVTIDPVPEYAELQRSVRPRDVMVEAAISDVPGGSVTFHQIADTGLSTLIDEVAAGHRAAGWAVKDVVVPARRLDDVLAGAGWEGLEIHFMVVDVEGAERAVLETIDLKQWRPWVLVVEATQPLTSVLTHESWESVLLDADYRFCLFDGLSRFYVAGEKWAELHGALSVPANVLDGFERYQVTVL